MLDSRDDRTITANVDEVLDALRTNLTEHKEIVTEARRGYLDKAQTMLGKRMAQLRSGKLVRLDFSLSPPTDHSRDFETVIRMLELHAGAHVTSEASPKATIELKATDVQRFVLNDWSWARDFFVANSAYSDKSAHVAAQKGWL